MTRFFYVVISGALSVLLAGSVLWSVGRDVLPSLSDTVAARGHSPEMALVALLCLVFGAWASVCWFAGPVALRAGEVQWSPAVAPRLRLSAFQSLALGTAPALLLALPFVFVGPWVALAVLLGLLALGVLVGFLQWRDSAGLARGVAFSLLLAGVGVALATAFTWWASALLLFLLPRFRSSFRLPALDASNPAARGELVPKWQLRRAAANRWAMSASVITLDAGVVRSSLSSPGRAARLPAFVPRWGPAAVVAARGLPGVAPALLAGVGLCLSVAELLGPLAGARLLMAGLSGVVVALSRDFDAWTESAALQRLWGRDAGTPLLAPALILCVLLAVLAWVFLSLPALPGALLVALPFAVSWRRLSARRAEPGEGALLATPMGAVPLHTLNRTIAGPDVVFLATLLTLL